MHTRKMGFAKREGGCVGETFSHGHVIRLQTSDVNLHLHVHALSAWYFLAVRVECALNRFGQWPLISSSFIYQSARALAHLHRHLPCLQVKCFLRLHPLIYITAGDLCVWFTAKLACEKVCCVGIYGTRFSCTFFTYRKTVFTGKKVLKTPMG